MNVTRISGIKSNPYSPPKTQKADRQNTHVDSFNCTNSISNRANVTFGTTVKFDDSFNTMLKNMSNPYLRDNPSLLVVLRQAVTRLEDDGIERILEVSASKSRCPIIGDMLHYVDLVLETKHQLPFENRIFIHSFKNGGPELNEKNILEVFNPTYINDKELKRKILIEENHIESTADLVRVLVGRLRPTEDLSN